MSTNILNILTNQVSGNFSTQASSFLNEEQNMISKALGGIFPSLLGALISKGSNEEGAKSIIDMTKKVDSDIIDDVTGVFSGSRPDTLMSSGDNLLNTLLGNKVGGAADLISKISGIKNESSKSLFKMAAPILIGIIGRQVKKDNLGTSGLMNMLQNQKEHVERNIPAGMSTILGLGSLFTGAKESIADATKTAVGVTKETASYAKKSEPASAEFQSPSEGNLWRFLIPALLILGAIYLLTQSRMCSDTPIDKVGDTMEKNIKESVEDVEEAVVEGAETVKEGMEKTWEAVKGSFLNVNLETKAMLDSMSFDQGTAGYQMVTFIERGDGNALFKFKNLNFVTGSAKINQETAKEVGEVASVLKTYPDVTIEISGHTDDTGEETVNEELSKARAEAVKARLTANGIDGNRIATKGYGSRYPIASNQSEEGKKENRRIEIRVTN